MSAALDAIITRATMGTATIKDGYYMLEQVQREAETLAEMIEQIESGTFPACTHKIFEPEDRHGT
jgi:hypothetical protein